MITTNNINAMAFIGFWTALFGCLVRLDLAGIPGAIIASFMKENLIGKILFIAGIILPIFVLLKLKRR